MSEPLNILIIEDSNADFLMVERHLRQNGLSARCSRVDTLEGLKEAIGRESWDLVLSDYSIPQLNFQESLILVQTAFPDLPVILVTGTVGEEKAVELLKLGVQDFVLKENLARLVPAIDRSLREVAELRIRRAATEALRRNEAKTRSILDNIGIGVALISPKMEVLEMNHLMRKWFPGVDPGNCHVCYCVFNDPPSEAVCDNCPTQKTLQDSLVHENTIQTAQAGGTRNYRIISSPILNAAGEVTAAIEMVEDITDKLSLESQLRQAQKMEAVGQLAGGVAHDFNNILSAIFGYSHLILDKVKENDPVHQYVEEIMAASKRAADLTHGLLAFSRKQPVSLAVIDLCEVIKGNESFLRRLVREDVELKINCTGESLTVLADRGQIEQVIMNLVANASDAMPNGGKLFIETQPVTLDREFVETHGYGQAGEYALFTVSDSGVGMDKETQSHIFEPFFTTKEQGKGTGLGLSMAYGIVKKHDGFINVYSEPGTGTIFKIYLPRVQATEQVVKMEIKDVAPLRGGAETILVVEDDAALLRLSTKVLKHYGYRVIEAVDGQDAVDKFIEYGDSIHLVILDAIMPKKNGKVACDEMKILRPDLKVIFTSGYARDIFGENNTFDENTNFINKPYSPDKLMTMVREMLDKK
jgi:signal transduction histidine kinase/DNA-binding response OmpR family regulator